ncbi:MAG TPA: tetratricopeptide repeat protein [Allosphingosinicella sp.]|nr:tetratricopeptide repeat protein [Allosphingosinicella sp.]
MAWIALILLAVGAFGAIWRFGRLDAAELQIVGAALLLGMAGYAWQGRPGLAGSPKTAAEQRELPESDFARMRQGMAGRFDTADRWLTIAESYQRRGDTRAAAGLIRSALRAHPDNAILWLGYGNALVMHAAGLVTPAAELAFGRAAVLAPDHPAPRFFYGLSLAQSGRLDEAERVWRELAESAPPDARWRSGVERQLELIDQARPARSSAQLQ